MANAGTQTTVMSARISVIVPCHNHGHLLGDALESIAAQDVPGLEVIVVDDRSTDDTIAVATQKGAQVLSSGGIGAGAARNTGVLASSGGILGFLDADDLWPRDSLRRRLGALEGNDAAYGAVEEIVDADLDGAKHAPRAIRPARLIGAMLITRRAWDLVGPMNEMLTAGEFIDWVARFDAAGLRAAKVNDVVLQRRLHAANTSRNVDPDAANAYLEVARLHRRRQGR